MTRMVCVLAAGCGSLCMGCLNASISGTISLPAGMTAAAGMKCGDIEVAAFTRFLDSQDEITSAAATGDISTGRCSFEMSVQSGQSFQVGSRPFHPTDLKYTDCPEKFRTTFIDEQSLSLLLPFPVTLNLKMLNPRTGCP